MSQINTRHTVRTTNTLHEASLWVLWRLCALPLWGTRVTATLVTPHLITLWGQISTVAHEYVQRFADLRTKPGTTYIGIVTAVVLLALFSGLIGHVS